MISAPLGVRVYLACGTTDIEERFLLRAHPETSARTDGVFGCMV